MRDPAKAKPKTPDVRKKGQKLKFRIVKLEERIAPKLATNHNDASGTRPAEGEAEDSGCPLKGEAKARRQATTTRR